VEEEDPEEKPIKEEDPEEELRRTLKRTL